MDGLVLIPGDITLSDKDLYGDYHLGHCNGVI